jgi:putative acetyltransferase
MNAATAFALRRYQAADEEASIALWHRTWQAAYPQIDFAARLDWWRKRWRDELLPVANVVVAESNGALAGFVTVDPNTLYLDQLVVAPEHWRSGLGGLLVGEAQRISPRGLDLDVNIDNFRAIRFYEKQGFTIAGEGKNPLSGKPVHRMSWRP